jgi:hypothetical protein
MKLDLESDLTFENQMILLWKVIINLATTQNFEPFPNFWNIETCEILNIS